MLIVDPGLICLDIRVHILCSPCDSLSFGNTTHTKKEPRRFAAIYRYVCKQKALTQFPT